MHLDETLHEEVRNETNLIIERIKTFWKEIFTKNQLRRHLIIPEITRTNNDELYNLLKRKLHKINSDNLQHLLLFVTNGRENINRRIQNA